MPSMTGREEVKLSFGKQLAFCLLIMLLLVTIAEAGVRTWAHYFRTSYETFNPETNRLELVRGLRFIKRGEEFVINSKGFLGPEFEKKKPDGVFRIFVLGDSCTFSDGLWEKGYPAMVERRLNGSGSGLRYEVVNAGIEGYNSTQALGRLKDEILTYEPDMVMIYVGWNDLMKSTAQTVSDSPARTLIARIKEESYLIKAFRKVIFFYVRPSAVKPQVGPEAAANAAFEDFVPTRYASNLEEMLGTLRDHGVKAMLFTLPTVVTSDMTHEDLEKNNVMFPYFPRANNVQSLLNLVTAYNGEIRRIGREHNVPVVDLERRFNAFEKDDLFWDTMHPSYRGKELIAAAIVDTLKEIRANDRECRSYGWEDLCGG